MILLVLQSELSLTAFPFFLVYGVCSFLLFLYFLSQTTPPPPPPPPFLSSGKNQWFDSQPQLDMFVICLFVFFLVFFFWFFFCCFFFSPLFHLSFFCLQLIQFYNTGVLFFLRNVQVSICSILKLQNKNYQKKGN